MARPLATSSTLQVAAAAAGAWLALGLLLVAVPVAPPVAPSVAAMTCHVPTTSPAWQGADRVYGELDRLRGVGAAERTRLARVILEEAARAELAPALVLAVIHVESRFDARAVSPVGAVGLMQLMLPTLREELALARVPDADPFDPVTNVRAGVRYLARLVGAFSDVELALMAYNAGPNRIRRHLAAGGVPVRFLGYPREVLRQAARLATAGVPALALAARAPWLGLPPVHAVAPVRGERAAVHPAARAGAVTGPVLAALEGGAPDAAGNRVAAAPRGCEPADGATGAPGAPARDACTRLEPALPMGRGRDRPRSLERAVQG